MPRHQGFYDRVQRGSFDVDDPSYDDFDDDEPDFDDGQERRVDSQDEQPYTRQEFKDCYGGTQEWDAAPVWAGFAGEHAEHVLVILPDACCCGVLTFYLHPPLHSSESPKHSPKRSPKLSPSLAPVAEADFGTSAPALLRPPRIFLRPSRPLASHRRP